MTALAAKGVVAAYYGRGPAHSYFTGCSCGGGQALSEAQRYPADYDGIVAGAPANFPTHMWPGELYPAWVTHRTPAHLIPEEKLPIIDEGRARGLRRDGRRSRMECSTIRGAARSIPATLLCKGDDAPGLPDGGAGGLGAADLRGT